MPSTSCETSAAPVPWPGGQARAGYPRSAAENARLLPVPSDAAACGRRRSRRVLGMPLDRAYRPAEDEFGHWTATPPTLDAQRRPRRGLERAPQDGGRCRQQILFQLPQQPELYRLPRRPGETAPGPLERLDQHAPDSSPSTRPALQQLPSSPVVMRRLPPTSRSGANGTPSTSLKNACSTRRSSRRRSCERSRQGRARRSSER